MGVMQLSGPVANSHGLWAWKPSLRKGAERAVVPNAIAETPMRQSTRLTVHLEEDSDHPLLDLAALSLHNG